jgi:hypothetical protein
MQDQVVTEHGPILLRDDRHEVVLDLHRVFMLGQAHAARQPADVCIHRDARYAEGIAQDDVGRFAADPWQDNQVVQAVGDRAAVVLDESLAAGLDVARLVAEEAGRLDRLFELA